MSNQFKKSFTLVELMIVTAILAILSAIVIFALNPARLFDNFRDSKRVTDIVTLNKAISFLESWNISGMNYGTSTFIYLSLPDASTSCSSYTLPTLAVGYSYACKPTSTYKNTDGTGWVPLNFAVSSSNNYLSVLPVDPINDATYYYSYFPGGSYELIARLKNSKSQSINDNGFYDDALEIGSPNRTNFTPVPKNMLSITNTESASEWNGVSSLSSDAYTGQYSLRVNGSGNLEQKNCFKIDRTKRHRFSGCFKSVGSGGLSQMLIGTRAFDYKNREITCEMTAHYTNTKTTLAQPLNPGDTTVYLTSVANYATPSGAYAGLYPFEDYPEYTYTRNLIYYNAVNVGNNSLTLTGAYSGVAMPAGTKIAQNRGSDSCTFNYMIQRTTYPVPNTWSCYNVEIGGQTYYQFRYGTTCIKLLFLMNFTQGSTYSILSDDYKFELISNN